MRHRYATLAGRLALVLMLVPSPAARATDVVTPREGIEERAEVRLLTLRLRIRPSFRAEPGACLALGAQDLDVRLRGARVDAGRVELDRRRERAVHALLIDTSGSMADSLDQVREAAAGYVRQLEPERERALIVTFDDSVLLQHPETADRDRLLAAIDGIQAGEATSLHDALYYTVDELALRRERAVIVLLTDGFDTASLHERDDVMERVRAHPDLTIFPIGFDLPALTASGPEGLGSIRHFLQSLAHRTNGKYVVAHTGSRLDDAYRRIREMLDSEAVLRVADPDPGAEARSLSVSSRRPDCAVDVLREQQPLDAPLLHPLARPWPELPHRFDVAPDRRYERTAAYRAFRDVDPRCARQAGERENPWGAEADREGIYGCVLDVTMDLGALYDPFAPSPVLGWADRNEHLRTRTRPFEIEVPALTALPLRLEDWVEQLGAEALEAAGHEVERDARRKPPERHARPFHDLPSVVNGRTFFDLRGELAQALFARPDYRAWALEELRAEAERELDDLREQYRRQAPRAGPEAIEAALLESDEGRAIRARAGSPAAADLTRLLAAWLGDLPAHELFLRWETDRLDALLAGRDDPAGEADFTARWVALRGLTFAPSYARELTLLELVHDGPGHRIGFYRIVLPRVGWMLPRVRDYEKHPGFSDLPLDLLPELPMAYRAMRRVLDEQPDLAAHLEREGYRARSLSYQSRMRPRRRTPERAFRECTASLVLAAGARRATLELDLAREPGDAGEVRLVALRASAPGDAILADLVRRLEAATVSAGLRGRI